MYEILTSKYKDCKLRVNIESPNPTGIPRSIMVGGGKLKTRYANYLEENGFKNQSLLRFLVYIHKEAKKVGQVALICNCRLGKESHAEVLKEFILKNRDTFDSMLPYLFPGEGYKGEDTSSLTGSVGIKDDDISDADIINEKDNNSGLNEITNVNNNNMSDISFDDLDDSLKEQIKNTLSQNQTDLSAGQSVTNIPSGNRVQLPKADMDIIMNMVREDQAKTIAENAAKNALQIDENKEVTV